MPIKYSNPTKVARMNATVAQIGANGKIKIYSAADVLLAVFTLATVAGTVSGAGVISFADNNGAAAGLLNTVGLADGVAAKATVTNAADVEIGDGLTVGGPASSADLRIDNVNIAVGQPVVVAAPATLTHAA